MPDAPNWLLANAAYATFLTACIAGLVALRLRPTVLHALYIVALVRLLVPPVFGLPLPLATLTDAAPQEASHASVGPNVTEVVIAERSRELPAKVGTEPGPGAPDSQQPVLAMPPEGRSAANRSRSEAQTPSTQPIQPAAHDVALGDNARAPGKAVRHAAHTSAPTDSHTTFAAQRRLSWPSLSHALVWLERIWLAGCGVWLLVAAVRIARMQRVLASAIAAPDWVQTLAESLSARFHLARCPLVLVVDGPVSPAVWPFGPRLVLPRVLVERMTQAELSPLIAHELVHVRRRDHWVRLLELAVTAVYWWLPTVWWIRRQLRQLEETCCDAWVVQASPQGAAAYARSLVAAIELTAASPRRAMIHPATGIGEMRAIRGRLKAIMLAQTPHRTTRLGWAIIGLAAAACWIVTPGLPVGAVPVEAVQRQAPNGSNTDPGAAAWSFDRLPPECDPLYKVLSPDGSMVAWVGSRVISAGEKEQGLFVTELPVGTTRRLLDQPLKSAPAWSPDSRRLAIGTAPGYAARYPLVLVDVQSGHVETTGATGVGAAWSPDGTEIAVTTGAQRGGSWSAGVPTDGRIGVWNLEQQSMRYLTPPAFHLVVEGVGWARAGAVRPVWSPAGTWIAFELLAGQRLGDEETSRHELWAVRRDAAALQRLLEAYQPHHWSEDGEAVIVDGDERVVALTEAPVVGQADWPQPDAKLVEAAKAKEEGIARARAFDPAQILERNRPWQNPRLNHLTSIEFTHRMTPVRLDERFSWRADGACSVEVVDGENEHAKKEVGRIWLLTPSGQQLTLAAGDRYPRSEPLAPDQVLQETLTHLMGTRMNCVALDWARHHDWFELSDVRPAEDEGQLVLELTHRRTPTRKRYYLNVGAMFHTLSWSYIHHLPVRRSELVVDQQTGRILKEIDYTSDDRPAVFVFNDWLDVGDGQSVPQSIQVEVPDHAFHCEYRFQWLPERLWLLESGKAWFDGKEPQMETLVDLEVNGDDPDVDRHLQHLQQQLKTLQVTSQGVGQVQPIRAIPLELGKVVPLEWTPADTPAAALRQWEWTVDTSGQRFRELGVRPTVRAKITWDPQADLPPAEEPAQLVLYDGRGRPVHVVEIPLGAAELLKRPAEAFLDRTARCSSLWLHPDLTAQPEVSYVFHDAEGNEAPYTTSDTSNPHFARGVTMTLALDTLTAHPQRYRMPVVFQAQWDGRPVEVAMITGPSFGSTFGNGIEHSWRGYSVTASTWCLLVVDQQTRRPILERYGNTEIRFLDYLEPQPGQYVPRRIVVSGQERPAYDFRFQVLDGRMWLFDRSYYGDEQTVVYVDGVRVDGREPRSVAVSEEPASRVAGAFDWSTVTQRRLLADADQPLARQIAAGEQPFASPEFDTLARMTLTGEASAEIDLGSSPFWPLVKTWSLSHTGQQGAALASSAAAHSQEAAGALPIEWGQVLPIHVPAAPVGQGESGETPATWLRTIRLDRSADGQITGTVELVSRQHFTRQATVVAVVLLNQAGVPVAAAESRQDLEIDSGVASTDIVVHFDKLPAGVEASHVRIGLATTTTGIFRSVWVTLASRAPMFPIERLLSSESPQVQQIGLQELYHQVKDTIRYEEGPRGRELAQRTMQGIAPYTGQLEKLITRLDDPTALSLLSRLAGHSGQRSFIPSLAKLLDHEAPEVRDSAAIGLGLLGDDRGAGRLRALYGRLKERTDRSRDEDRLFIEAQIALSVLGEAPQGG